MLQWEFVHKIKPRVDVSWSELTSNMVAFQNTCQNKTKQRILWVLWWNVCYFIGWHWGIRVFYRNLNLKLEPGWFWNFKAVFSKFLTRTLPEIMGLKCFSLLSIIVQHQVIDYYLHHFLARKNEACDSYKTDNYILMLYPHEFAYQLQKLEVHVWWGRNRFLVRSSWRQRVLVHWINSEISLVAEKGSKSNWILFVLSRNQRARSNQ